MSSHIVEVGPYIQQNLEVPEVRFFFELSYLNLKWRVDQSNSVFVVEVYILEKFATLNYSRAFNENLTV